MVSGSKLISFFIPTLGGGGAERVMVTLADGIIRRGRRVEVLTCDPFGPYADILSPSVITSLPRRRMSLLIPTLVTYLRARKPAVLVSAMKHCNVAALIARAISLQPTKTIITEHSDVISSLGAISPLKASLLQRLMRASYPKASAVVAVSNGVRVSLVESDVVNESSVKVIYNPIVDDRLAISATHKPQHMWCLDSSVPLLIAAGRLTDAKDYPTLLRAFALVRRTHDARLLILGEGECRQDLTKLVASLGLAESVSMPGFMKNPYAHMRSASAFVLSSSWEGFGNVLVEAMSLGIPVVSTDCRSGPGEILENGKWGRMVPVGNIPALAFAIIDALDGRVPPAPQRARAFSVTNSVAKYLELVDALISA